MPQGTGALVIVNRDIRNCIVPNSSFAVDPGN